MQTNNVNTDNSNQISPANTSAATGDTQIGLSPSADPSMETTANWVRSYGNSSPHRGNLATLASLSSTSPASTLPANGSSAALVAVKNIHRILLPQLDAGANPPPPASAAALALVPQPDPQATALLQQVKAMIEAQDSGGSHSSFSQEYKPPYAKYINALPYP